MPETPFKKPVDPLTKFAGVATDAKRVLLHLETTAPRTKRSRSFQCVLNLNPPLLSPSVTRHARPWEGSA